MSNFKYFYDETSDLLLGGQGLIGGTLKRFIARSVVGMTTDNAKSVKSLLLKYTHLFAASDADLGQTKVTEHNTKTGTANPVKQLPPPTVHMQDESDRHVDD